MPLPKGVHPLRVDAIASSPDDTKLAIFIALSDGRVAVVEMTLAELAEQAEVFQKYAPPFCAMRAHPTAH